MRNFFRTGHNSVHHNRDIDMEEYLLFSYKGHCVINLSLRYSINHSSHVCATANEGQSIVYSLIMTGDVFSIFIACRCSQQNQKKYTNTNRAPIKNWMLTKNNVRRSVGVFTSKGLQNVYFGNSHTNTHTSTRSCSLWDLQILITKIKVIYTT
jgi:hypothetical protein